MLIEPLILIFVLELYAWPTNAAAKPPQHLFRLLKMDTGITSSFLSRNSERNRRPTPSEYLPIEDLLESNNPIYDPLTSDIDIKTLRKKLGRAYDKRYMSIYSPNLKHQNKPFFIPLKKGRPAIGKRPRFLNRLRSTRLQDGRKIRLNVSKKDRRKFQKYIWSLTFCPVKQSWKDLSIRFWPRWIKEGACTSKRSCSIPEGMRCKPSDSTYLTFLRWYCADYKSRKDCKWIKMQYPIITECSCKC